MSKNTLIQHIELEQVNKYSAVYLKFFIDTLLDLLVKQLYLGNIIKIRNFGTFYTKMVNSNFSKNVIKVKFRASSTLKDKFNI